MPVSASSDVRVSYEETARIVCWSLAIAITLLVPVQDPGTVPEDPNGIAPR